MTNTLRRASRVLLLMALATLLFAALLWPVQAAVVLQDFKAIVTANTITLVWKTTSELDMVSFDVMCKRADEPTTAYHKIASIKPLGGPGQGQDYGFQVDPRALIPGVAYCFQLREINVHNQPGEVRELCGYGLGITPTPTVVMTGSLTGTLPLSGTIIITTAAGLTQTGTFSGQLTTASVTDTNFITDGVATPVVASDAFNSPLLTLTPFPTQTQQLTQPVQGATDANGNPLPGVFDANGNPLPSAFDANGNPLPAVFDANGNLLPSAFDANGNPLPTQTPTETPTATYDPNQVPTETETPTETPTITPTSKLTDSVALGGNNALADTTGAQANAAALPGTPTSPYVVITTTPTPEGLAVAATFTPLPTATQPGLSLARVFTPNNQNILLGLLCLSFFGFSSLGILGLISSLLYMRARADRSRLRRDF